VAFALHPPTCHVPLLILFDVITFFVTALHFLTDNHNTNGQGLHGNGGAAAAALEIWNEFPFSVRLSHRLVEAFGWWGGLGKGEASMCGAGGLTEVYRMKT
jgi:hypothetical protein